MERPRVVCVKDGYLQKQRKSGQKGGQKEIQLIDKFILIENIEINLA